MKKLLTTALFVVVGCSGSISSGTAPVSSYLLSVVSYVDWCTVTVDSAPLTATGTYSFDAGTVVSLEATANAGFTWAYWLGTDGATAANGGEDPNMATTVTLSRSKEVLACCNNPPNELCPTSL